MRLDDDDDVDQLSTLIAHTRAELVVIDSLSRAHDAASENDNALMGGVMLKLERLRSEDGVAILLLAHANAAGEARGASAITAACDNEFRLARASESLESPITITRHKARQAGVERVRLRFRGLAGEPMAPELVEDKVKPKRTQLSEHARHVATAVREHGPISANRIVKLGGISSRDVGPALKEGAVARLIEQNEDDLWIATAAEDEAA